MYLTLPESAARRRARAGYLASAFLHAGLLALLLTNHGWTAPVRDEPHEVSLHYAVANRPEAAVRAASPSTSGVGAPSFTVPVLNIPVVVPNGIPTTVSLETAFDPAEFARRAFAEDTASGKAAPRPMSGETPFTSAAVDRQVQPLMGNPVPKYPSALQAMGVEGSVTIYFIVDTLGRVEPLSVEVLRSTHPLFERAVREALPRMRFAAAEVRGRKVAQIVEQAFHFAMKP